MEAFRLIISCIADLIICFLYIVTGLCLMYNPPKEVNSLYGYMSKYAKKSPEAWSFAQNYMGRCLFRFGIITLILLVPVYFVISRQDNFQDLRYILLIVQLIIGLIARAITETALRKKFNPDGTIKTS